MAKVESVQSPRLLARFLLRQSGEGHAGHMPLSAGDYVTETRIVGDDLEVLMFEREETATPH
jgi:hypothetical protein